MLEGVNCFRLSRVRLDLNKLGAYVREANESGWGVGIHCCGDLAQDIAVSAQPGFIYVEGDITSS